MLRPGYTGFPGRPSEFMAQKAKPGLTLGLLNMHKDKGKCVGASGYLYLGPRL